MAKLELITEHMAQTGNLVSIANGYGLDGPEIESCCGARFSAPVQKQPPVQWVPGLSRG